MTTTIKFDGHLDREFVELEASNSETFVSKLSKVHIVQITHGENNDGYTNAVIASDGRTITFYTTASADTTMFVTIYGRK